ncbi:MAG: hypothetical protein ACRCRP_00515 [Metamycoplasmataceae bacterium]
MNKKILISLGSLSTIAVVAPILATISCSNTEQVSKIDLNIIPKTQQKLSEQEVIYLKGNDPSKYILVLQKLFDGIINENLNKFTFIVSNTNIVTLKANQGYLINNKETIVSPAFIIENPNPPITDINLDIKANSNVSLTGIELFDLQEGEISKKILILQKLFTGISNTNYNNFTFVISGNANNKIFLIAKNGYKINKQETLENNFTLKNIPLNIKLQVHLVTITRDEENILREQSSPSNASQQLAVLQKLFNGITNENYKYVSYYIDSVTDLKITHLNTKPGFVFGTDPNSNVKQLTTSWVIK